ncbi:MAG: hypothetical protein LBE09_00260, partial [Christensenellaceae bacterium]|nr:hypothetical protein [Christensenellaceae bacterium]
EQNTLSAYNRIDKENIAKIELTEESQTYLKKEYYVNQSIDKKQIKMLITYDDETVSEPILIPASLYTTDFASTEAATDSTMVISVDEKIYNESTGKTTYETHTIEHTYSVVAPRATETKTEKTDVDEIAIGDIKINRYDTAEVIKQKLGDLASKIEIMDINKKYEDLKKAVGADANEIDAYRLLIENMSKSYKTMTYVYNSAYETAVTNAFSVEKKKQIMSEYDDEYWKAEVIKEFKYLYSNSKQTYAEIEDVDDAIAVAFAESIKSNLDTFYYYPVVEDLGNYSYVYQILFNFTDKQKELLTQAGTNEELKAEYFEYLKNYIESQISNINYSADYDCEKHELGLEDEECKWIAEGNTNESECPSLAYMTDENGDYIKEAFVEVYARLQEELFAIAGEDLTGLNTEENQRKAFEIFKEYMYKYNDDSGIMNSSTGYLIAPEGIEDPNGFYDSFVDLAHDVYAAKGVVGNAFVETDDGYKLGYAFTDYGVHLIMVSLKPFENYNGEEALLNATDEEIFEFISTTRINVAGELTEDDPTANTIYKALLSKLKTDRETKLYNDYTNQLISEKMHEDTTKVKTNEKYKESLYEQVSGE